MRLSDLNISTRLYGGFAGIIVLLVALVTLAYTNFSNLNHSNELNVHTYQVLAEVDGIMESLLNTETGERGFALTGKPASLEAYDAGKTNFAAHLQKAKALTADNAQQQDRLNALAQAQANWLAQGIDPVIALRRNTADDNMGPLISLVQEGKARAGMEVMRGIIGEIAKNEQTLLAQRSKDAASAQSLAATTQLAGGALSIVLAAIIAGWLARNITRPLRRAVDLAQQVANGDLTANVVVDSRDEIGELMAALKAMNASLSRIVGEVRSGTDSIATASAEIMSGNQDLSSRTEQQASSLEETASSMEELTSTVTQTADNAGAANTLASAASDVAVKGGAAVAEVVSTMHAINESSRKIVDIISVIDGIAFQTNILALNAAVEAARAGEQGRGFAVVASEVRNLAQRSAGAAKEIKELISNSVDKVELGTKLVSQAGATMDEVVASVRRVSDIIGDIANASTEQRTGIEQVNEAITQMDAVTQQNAALVEQATAASEAMRGQADRLASTVSVFKLNGVSASAPAPRPVSRPVPVRSVAPARGKATQQLAAAQPAKAARPAKTVSQSGDDGWEEF
ncbi:MAG: methyl-accepting chemotaxis protein [Pseudomonadota bacterium]